MIVFTDKPDRDWWDIFTVEGFRHCYVCMWDEWAQRWLLVDWRRTSLDYNILFDFEMEKVLRATRELKGTVVEFFVQPDIHGVRNRGVLQYCSRHIAKMLNLGNQLILTPRGLYRRLLGSGGEVVYSWRHHENQEQAHSGRAQTARNPD